MNSFSANTLASTQIRFNTLLKQFNNHPFLGGLAVGAVLAGGVVTSFVLHETGVLPAVPQSPVIS